MRTLLKIRVEKIIEVEGDDGTRHIGAGSYEQTISDGGEECLAKANMKIFKQIVALVNGLKPQ